jgi:hypothetical protein
MSTDRKSLTVSTTTIAASPLPPGWLAKWQPDQVPPVPADEIAASLRVLESALAPVEPMALATYAERALSIFPKPDNWATQCAVYFSALSDLPDDLARMAFARVVANCRFWPRPAEVREQVASELRERRVAVNQLALAKRMAQRMADSEARRKRDAAPLSSMPVTQPWVNRITDLPKAPEEIVVTPEDAAARVAEWTAELARTA